MLQRIRLRPNLVSYNVARVYFLPAESGICLVVVESIAKLIPTLHSSRENVGPALNLAEQELVYQGWIYL